MLAHNTEDRYITYREAMTIMGLPSDFELIDPKKNMNHMCQNVPVRTAFDMATMVKRTIEDRSSFMWNKGETYTNNASKRTDVINYH
jgi:site-specific DNA-cytosine methylase